MELRHSPLYLVVLLRTPATNSPAMKLQFSYASVFSLQLSVYVPVNGYDFSP